MFRKVVALLVIVFSTTRFGHRQTNEYESLLGASQAGTSSRSVAKCAEWAAKPQRPSQVDTGRDCSVKNGTAVEMGLASYGHRSSRNMEGTGSSAWQPVAFVVTPSPSNQGLLAHGALHHYMSLADITPRQTHTRTRTRTRTRTLKHSTAQHSTAQHSTAQHSTAQHSTAQHSTAQHSKPCVLCSVSQNESQWRRSVIGCVPPSCVSSVRFAA